MSRPKIEITDCAAGPVLQIDKDGQLLMVCEKCGTKDAKPFGLFAMEVFEGRLRIFFCDDVKVLEAFKAHQSSETPTPKEKPSS